MRFAAYDAADLLLLGLSFYCLILARRYSMSSSRPALWFSAISFSLFFIYYSLNNAYFVASIFSGDGINAQAIEHLISKSIVHSGGGWVDYQAALAVLAFIFLLTWFVALISPRQTWLRTQPNWFKPLALSMLALIFHPGSWDITQVIFNAKPIEKVDPLLAKHLVIGQVSGDSLEKIKLQITKPKDQRRSIVLIYLQGPEKANLRPDLYPGVAPELSELAKSSDSNGKFIPTYGIRSSIAGIVSTQCGVPWTGSTGNGHHASDGGGRFYMQDTRCLGDLSKALGYRNIFYQGNSLTSHQVGSFFRAHGYSEVKGSDELRPLVSGKQTRGRLSDSMVFELASNRIAQLSNRQKAQEKQPFLFTIVARDSRDPYGLKRKSKDCEISDSSEQTNNFIRNRLQRLVCTDKVVSDFVEKIQKANGENLDIYILSDYLAKPHAQLPVLGTLKDRELIFLDLNREQDSSSDLKAARLHTHLDVAAVLADKLTDGEIQRLGIGVSILSSEPTLLELLGKQLLDKKIKASFSTLAKNQWRYPSLAENTLRPDFVRQELIFGDAVLAMPIALGLDKNNTILSSITSDIGKMLQLIKQEQRIIYFDHCSEMKRFRKNNFPKSAYCVFAGDWGAEKMMFERVSAESEYSLADFLPYFEVNSDSNRRNKRLFERRTKRAKIIGSAASPQIAPLAQTIFVAGRRSPTRMVTNYRDPASFEDFTDWENHRKASRDGLYLFQIKNGRVKRLKVWTACNQANKKNINQFIQESDSTEFVLMTARGGAACSSQNNQFSNSKFYPQVSKLKRSEAYIGYLNTVTDSYTFVQGPVRKNVELRLINERLYSK